MKAERRLSRLVGAAAFSVGGLTVAGVGGVPGLFPVGAADAAPSACTSAGSTGLTAALIATTGESISARSIDATGCDLGIYIGPGITGVTVGGSTAADAVTVSGANDTGILVEQTSGITIEGAEVQNNGVNPNRSLPSFGGIVLAGVSNATVTRNTVTDNGGGALFVSDDGPVDPAAPNPGPSVPVASTNDTVSQNEISGN